MVPSTKIWTPASQALAKKKDEVKKAALALVKEKDMAEKANAPADATPLPPAMEEPQMRARQMKQPVPPRVFCAAKDTAGTSPGRRGTVREVETNDHWQVFLDEVNKNVSAKLVWVKKEHLQEIQPHEASKKWERPQLTQHKEEVLLEAGTIGEDVDEHESWDQVEVLGSKCPPQTMIYGWLLLSTKP